MEPQTTPSPEQGPKPSKPERVSFPKQGETSGPTPEKLPPKGETPGSSVPIPPASLPRPVTADPEDTTADGPKAKPPSAQNVGPAVADDVDVIEKEWVDKAKAIVDEHKHDPYNQEKETSKLQADYLKKRYGKDVKLSA